MTAEIRVNDIVCRIMLEKKKEIFSAYGNVAESMAGFRRPAVGLDCLMMEAQKNAARF
jgi:hypothetical protein